MTAYGPIAADRLESKPLRVGVVYNVATASEGSAVGGGKLLVTKQLRVVNLP